MELVAPLRLGKWQNPVEGYQQHAKQLNGLKADAEQPIIALTLLPHDVAWLVDAGARVLLIEPGFSAGQQEGAEAEDYCLGGQNDPIAVALHNQL